MHVCIQREICKSLYNIIYVNCTTVDALNYTTKIILSLYRWSQGLLFHQAMVDCARAAILIPLAHSLLYCVPVKKCSLVETAFLLLVTVSTINMLTIVLNDSPVFPEDDEEDGYQVSLIQIICLHTYGLPIK